MSGIYYLDYYLPEKYISIKEVLENIPQLSVPDNYNSLEEYCENFCNESGLNKISIEEKNDEIDILLDLLSKFFKTKNVDPDEIAYLIYISCFYNNPYTANGVSIPHYLQEEFKMKNASVIVMNQLCATTISAMGISKGLIDGSKRQYIIILSGLFVKKIEERYFIFTVGGDGAGIMVLSNDIEKYDIVDWLSLTDGLLSYNKYHNINKNINELVNIRKGVNLINNLLDKNGLSIDNIYLFIPQSVNNDMYQKLYANLLGIPCEKIFLKNIPKGGHLGDIDIIRNLKDSISFYPIPKEAYILLYAQGMDYSSIIWNTLLLKS